MAKCITGNFVQGNLVILFVVSDTILLTSINRYRKGDWDMCYVIVSYNKIYITHLRERERCITYDFLIIIYVSLKNEKL